MIKFVVRRPVKKIQRHYTPIDPDTKKIKVWFRFFSIKVIRIIFALFAVTYWGFLLLKNSILNHQYVIKRVLYDSWNIAWYDNPYVYKLINTEIKGENYYVVKTYSSKILKSIQSQFPMISDVMVEYTSSNTVSVTLTFTPIDLVIRNQDLRFALIADKILPIYSWNKIANGIKILDLPSYLSGVTSLSGLFYRQSASGLVQQVDLLYQGFPGLQKIEYLPGGERSIVYVNEKIFYISNLGDILSQIKNYDFLKKYYTDYNKLKEIDLGSLEKNKIIVKKM